MEVQGGKARGPYNKATIFWRKVVLERKVLLLSCFRGITVCLVSLFGYFVILFIWGDDFVGYIILPI
jgi:hypothetical protein